MVENLGCLVYSHGQVYCWGPYHEKIIGHFCETTSSANIGFSPFLVLLLEGLRTRAFLHGRGFMSSPEYNFSKKFTTFGSGETVGFRLLLSSLFPGLHAGIAALAILALTSAH